MKIIHIDASFHTQYGYHVSPISKEQVKQGHEVYIITVPSDNLYPVFSDFGDTTSCSDIERYDVEFEQKYGVHIVRCGIWGYISGRALYKKKIYQIIDKINPDIIYCHNIDELISIKLILKKRKYPLVFDSHMLEMASKNKFANQYRFIYKHFITPSIVKHKDIVIRTQNDPYVNKCLGIPERQSPFLSFGTDTNMFYYDETLKQQLRKQMGIGHNDFVVCYTGKLTPEKGADLLVGLVQKTYISGEYDRVVFLIVGNTNGEYGKKIERGLQSEKNIVLRYPVQKYVDLPKFYQASDLSIFPKQCSLSFYDAQACGLPVLSEDNLVNVNRCSNQNGFNFKAGNTKDFCEKLQQCVLLPKKQYVSYRQGAIDYIACKYSYASITKEIDEILTEAVDRYHKVMR